MTFEDAGAKISVGERGFKDSIVMERFWRSYKWEFVYLMEKMDLKELKKKTKQRVEYYNRERPHQSLDYKTPEEVSYGREYKKGCSMNKKSVIYCPNIGEHFKG